MGLFSYPDKNIKKVLMKNPQIWNQIVKDLNDELDNIIISAKPEQRGMRLILKNETDKDIGDILSTILNQHSFRGEITIPSDKDIKVLLGKIKQGLGKIFEGIVFTYDSVADESGKKKKISMHGFAPTRELALRFIGESKMHTDEIVAKFDQDQRLAEQVRKQLLQLETGGAKLSTKGKKGGKSTKKHPQSIRGGAKLSTKGKKDPTSSAKKPPQSIRGGSSQMKVSDRAKSSQKKPEPSLAQLFSRLIQLQKQKDDISLPKLRELQDMVDRHAWGYTRLQDPKESLRDMGKYIRLHTYLPQHQK